MSYMGSIAMQGKSIVGSPTEPIMPHDAAFRALNSEPEIHHEIVTPGEKPLPVSSVYGTGPEVMDRRK